MIAKNNEKAIQILDKFLEEISNLEFRDLATAKLILIKLEIFLNNISDVLIQEYDVSEEDLEYFNNTFKSIMDDFISASTDNAKYLWEENVKKVYGIVDLLKFQLIIDSNLKENIVKKSNEIFIVHGHDLEMLNTVARFLEKIGLKPIILNEKVDKGRTIIEKFEAYSNVVCAIVLFSPDDKFVETNNKDKEIFRSRQNVVLEFGYFMGKLGRDHIIALYKEDYRHEFPSDISGVIYKPYKSGWEVGLAKELKEIGLQIDLNMM